jgi:undecaprenyl-diphosphatase
MTLYSITDWLGLVPIAFVLGFGFLGLFQWLKRKHIKNVDYSIFVLGGFYIVVMAVYILFEYVVINYRPVLINGYLEVSYPSSTTLLVMCVIPTAIMQLKSRIKNTLLNRCVCFSLTTFIIFMVVGRIISGVHWITDIIGGALLSAGLVMLYYSIINLKK